MTPAAQAGWRILVPLDGSLQGQRAVAYARALATATDARINLLWATHQEAEVAADSLARHAADLQQAGLSVEWSVVDSYDAVSAIVETARVWRADVIVIATRKWSGVDR